MRGRNGRSLQAAVFGSLGKRNVAIFLHELLRYFLAQVDRKEALRQLDRMELCPQCFEDLLPLSVAGQTTSWSTSYAMLAIQLHVERIERMTTRGKGDADGIVVSRLAASGINVVLGLVEFEADLGQVVEFGDGVAGDLGLHTAFENAVEERVDV